jgi:hypothetical protein
MPLQGEAKRAYQRTWLARRRALFFKGKVCEWCGATARLELHHRDPSRKLHHAIWSWGEARRSAEVAKCMVLCDPCHERAHAAARRVEAELRNPCGTYASYKRGCRCQSCRVANRDYQRDAKARRAA